MILELRQRLKALGEQARAAAAAEVAATARTAAAEAALVAERAAAASARAAAVVAGSECDELRARLAAGNLQQVAGL
jgi:hypothetical protein